MPNNDLDKYLRRISNQFLYDFKEYWYDVYKTQIETLLSNKLELENSNSDLMVNKSQLELQSPVFFSVLKLLHFLTDDLSRYQNRKTGWIRDDERGRYNLFARIHCFFQRSFEFQVIAVRIVIAEVIGRPYITFGSDIVGAETIMKPAEIRQWRQVVHQVLDATVK